MLNLSSNAKIFVGGVPMIAADMVAFVESDLLVFWNSDNLTNDDNACNYFS